MASRTHVAPRQGTPLPDLPPDLFGDDGDLYASVRTDRENRERRTAAFEVPATRRPANRALPSHRPAPSRVTARAATVDDMVTNVTVRPEPVALSKPLPRKDVIRWSAPVLPQPAQMLDLALPNLITGVAAALVVLMGTFSPFGIPVWSGVLFVPIVLLAFVASGIRHPAWKQVALVNVATLAILFPALIVRQSVISIPFVDGGNGTLLAPAVATIAVILVLGSLAIACSILSQEDPENAGMLFLPAAMMVPLMAGQSDLIRSQPAFLMVTGIYIVAAGLTVFSSILPGAWPSLVAPLAIGLEFLILTFGRETSIFPIGSGNSAKLLFFTIVLATVALASAVPSLSSWVRQVTRLTERRSLA